MPPIRRGGGKGSGYPLQSFFSCLKKSISAPIPHAGRSVSICNADKKFNGLLVWFTASALLPIIKERCFGLHLLIEELCISKTILAQVSSPVPSFLLSFRIGQLLIVEY